MNKFCNTIFLRLEGPMQAWGGQESKFVIRKSMEAPTKSGIIGLICAAMGIAREKADADNGKVLRKLAELNMGVRIDKPGIRWWDYHTVGAGIGSLTAEGKVKYTAKTKEIETFLSRREYLCDASFLVALQGSPPLIEELHNALLNPVWTLYLGRKSCPPSVPVYNGKTYEFENLETALCSDLVPWKPRYRKEKAPIELECLFDWRPTADELAAPDDAEIWYDVPDSFFWPSHHPRFVIRKKLKIGVDLSVGDPLMSQTPSPERPRADYTNRQWKKVRYQRLEKDNNLCVFCKMPATTVQHITYRHAGGNERIDELRALCRLCHDAVTMLEYGDNMGMERIDPVDQKWRESIIEKRNEIIEYRSLKTRRRKLSNKEIE
jgi:CRISPR system Cascade subunit CasD